MALVVFFLGSAITVVSAKYVQRSDETRAHLEFVIDARTATDGLVRELNDIQWRVRAVAGLYEANTTVSMDQFRTFVAQLGGASGLGGLGFIELVSDNDLAAFLDDVRKDIGAYTPFSVGANGGRLPVPPGQVHALVRWFEPADAYGDLRGFDVFSEAMRREALTRAGMSRSLVVSPFLRLVGTSDSDGFLLYWPVEQPGIGLVGYAFAAADMGDVVSAAVPSTLLGKVELQVAGLGTGSPSPRGLATPVSLGDQTLQVVAVPVASQTEGSQHLIVFSGLLGSLVLAAVGWLVTRTRRGAEASNERFRALFDTAGDAIITVGHDEHIIMANPAAESVFGYTRDGLHGVALAALLPTRHRDIHSGRVAQFIAGDESARLMTARTELWGLRRDGTEFPVEVSIARLDRTDGVAATAIVRDRTERRQAELALEARRVELEKALASKDALIASISHEMRTPLAAVSGFADLLREGPDLTPEDRKEMVDMIVTQSAELAHIVDDLLVAAKAESGTLAVVHVVVDPLAQVRQVLEAFPNFADREIRVEGESVPMVADPARVRQILRNLLANAHKYGGQEVWVEVANGAQGVSITVCDDGLGVGAPEAERIFEPYTRAHASPGLTDSLGIGLAVARALAEKMDGSLSYGRRGGVTLFTLTLPRADESVARTGPVPGAAAGRIEGWADAG